MPNKIIVIIPQYFLTSSINNILGSGIYEIYFEDRPEYKYIGSTCEKLRGKTISGFRARWNRHLRDLINNKHCNSHLQRVFNIKTISKIKFRVIENCKIDIILKREQYYIDYYDSYKNGFNAVKNAHNTLGFKVPQNIVNKRKIPLLQYDLNGTFIKEWESTIDVIKTLGGGFNGISIFNTSTLSAYKSLWRKKCSNNYPLQIESYIPNHKNKILCYDIKGYFIKEFDSYTIVFNELHIPTGNISKVIKLSNNKRSISCYGYIFKPWTKEYSLKIDPWYKSTGLQKFVYALDISSNICINFKSYREVSDKLKINRGTISNNIDTERIVKSRKTNKQFLIKSIPCL